MTAEYILTIDEGTTNAKAVLVDKNGTILAQASRSLSISYPQPGWVEQDPLEIWGKVQECIDEVLSNMPKVKLAAVGIANQRETIVFWDRHTGQPVGPCLVWQDKRVTAIADEVRRGGYEEMVRGRTGLVVDAEYPSGKSQWILDHVVNARARAENGELCLGSMDSWILWNLSGGRVHATDTSNASRTQLFDLANLTWDAELLELFRVPAAVLPDVKPSSGVFGDTIPAGRLPGGVPIASLIGDSHAALFGETGFQPGAIKATYGTGSSLMTPMQAPVTSQLGLSTTVAWSRQGATTYALEGNINITGAGLQWLGEFLGLPNPAAGVADLALQTPDSGGVYVVPAFAGLGAPYWKDTASGLITGLTRGSTAAHVARATLEAIAYQVRAVFECMDAESGSNLQLLLADGGASRNDMLMQLQADILGVPVLRNNSLDVTLLGAAYLAGLAVSFWKSDADILNLTHSWNRFDPQMSVAQRETLYAGWKLAVEQTILGL